MHSAKGLEFDYVYVAGMEENLFPSPMSVFSQKELEEERRLFYVAMTRAKCALTLSCAKTRYRWGSATQNPQSRFLKEIDPCWLNKPVSSQPEALFGSGTPAKFWVKSSPSSSALYGSNTSSLSAGYLKRRQSYGNRSEQRNTPTPFSSQPSSPNVTSPALTSGRPQVWNAPSPRPADPHFIAADPLHFKTGQVVEHEKFGRGTIRSMEGKNPADLKAMVHFEEGGTKTLLLKYAKMRILEAIK